MKDKEIKNKPGKKRRDIMNLFLLLAIIILLNLIGAYFFHRFDLTTEKRYTLNPKTKELLSKLDEGVYIKVYLEGEFNPAFTRLRNEAKEMLDEFRAFSGKEINYEFINIYEEKTQSELEKIQRQLYQKGLIPTELNIKTEKGNKTQIIFPGALVNYKGRETVWQIFKQENAGISPDQCVNNCVQALEYELSNSIRKLQQPVRQRIGIISGHGELDTAHINDMANALAEYYDVNFVTINHQLSALKKFKTIIIAQPDSVYDEKDKFIIDQFIMNGGRVLWCVDPVYTNEDSLRLTGNTLGLSNSLNLEDMLFNYGVRMNYNLVNDLQCAYIPINRGFKGGAPDFKMYPWVYAPLVLADSVVSKHSIVKNLDLVKFSFVSTLDTVSANGIKKTVLLRTSRYSRLQSTPARVSLAMTALKPMESQFNKPFQPIAVLLEGNFTSLYKNRMVASIANDSSINFVESGKPSAMIVIGDGDVIKNDNYYSKLGYDKYMKQQFANKTFLLNCVNYLCDGADLLSVRTREVKLRLLDRKKIKSQETKWRMINLLLPLTIVVVAGLFINYFRKRRYTKSNY